MYYAFYKRFKVWMHRTPGGISTELALHYAAYKLHLFYSSAKEAHIGSLYKYKKNKKLEADPNAVFFEGVHAARIVSTMTASGIKSVKK